MAYIYNDEDNVPMNGDVPYSYSIRTWDEVIQAWQQQQQQAESQAG